VKIYMGQAKMIFSTRFKEHIKGRSKQDWKSICGVSEITRLDHAQQILEADCTHGTFENPVDMLASGRKTHAHRKKISHLQPQPTNPTTKREPHNTPHPPPPNLHRGKDTLWTGRMIEPQNINNKKARDVNGKVHNTEHHTNYLSACLDRQHQKNT
jgi:hypothetical protein